MKKKLIIMAMMMSMVLTSIPVYAQETEGIEIGNVIPNAGLDTNETIIETEAVIEEISTETEAIIEEISTETESIVSSEFMEEETVIQTEQEIETEFVEETELVEELEEASDSVENFVRRLYEKVLNRNADPSGLKTWTDLLKSRQMSGAEVARGFIDSNEFKARNLNDKAYVTVLYNTFFDREPDNGGMQTWMEVLEDGMSRSFVFKGFAESQEFSNLCAKYGITRGSVKLTEARDQNMGVTKFVHRCYKVFLGRIPDNGGLNMWCEMLLSGKMSAKEVARGFVMSQEFQSKNMSNEDYVKTMYIGFFDRDADQGGLSTWVDILEDGNSRESVFYGFADSKEFRSLVSGFGLNDNWVGTPITYHIGKEEFVQILIDNRSKWQMDKYEGTTYTGYFDPGYSLIDLDLDGQPELVITMAGGTMHNAPTEVWRVKNGTVEKVYYTDAEDGEIQKLSLRYNKSNGQYVYVDTRLHRSGVYENYSSLVELYVNGNSVSENNMFAKVNTQTSSGNYASTYYQNGTKISQSQYDSRMSAYNANMVDCNLKYGFCSYSKWKGYSVSKKTSVLLDMYDEFSYTKR